jgi:hypothetical protein
MAKRPELTPADAQRIIEQRKKQDPCLYVKPSPTQEKFYKSPALYRLLTGQNQGGKTFWVCLELAKMLRGLHEHRPWFGPVKSLVLCKSRKQAAEIFGPYLLKGSGAAGQADQYPMIPAYEIAHVGWNSVGVKVPIKVELKNGSEILFAWSGMAAADELVQGLKVDVVVIDEDACDRQLMDELLPRLLIAQSNEAKKWSGCIMWSATGIRSNDVFHEFREKSLSPDWIDYAMFTLVGENPSVSASATARLAENLSPEQRRIRVEAIATGHNIVSIFNWEDHRHVAPSDYEPGPYDNLWASVDPGWRNYFAIMVAAISREQPRLLRVVRFFAHRKLTIEQNLEILAEYLNGRFLVGLTCDHSGGVITEKGSGKSVMWQIEEAMSKMGIVSRMGVLARHNRRDHGIPMVQRALDEGRIICNPTSEGCGLFRQMMIAYQKKPETAFSGLGNVKDKNTEGPDCMRYLVVREPVWDDYGPNIARGTVHQDPIERLEAIPEEVLTPEMRKHRDWLQLSIRRLEEMEPRERRLATGTFHLG